MRIILFIFSVLGFIGSVVMPSEPMAFVCALMGLFALSMAESYDLRLFDIQGQKEQNESC